MEKNFLAFFFIFFFSFSAFTQQDKELILLQANDVHSHLEPVNQEGDRDYDKGGFVCRATSAKGFCREHPDISLFDCGNIPQGTPYYNMFQGEVEVKMMNETKYGTITTGSHEFDFDLDNMARLFRMADSPVVCANYDVSATVLKDLVKPYVIIERDGVKTGVLGLGCQLEGMIRANKCVEVVYNDPVATTNEVAAVSKEKEGCDMVICLSHLGVQYDENRLIPKARNIDVVLRGHSHTFMKGPKTLLSMGDKSVSLMHTGKSGIYVGQTGLTLGNKE